MGLLLPSTGVASSADSSPLSDMTHSDTPAPVVEGEMVPDHVNGGVPFLARTSLEYLMYPLGTSELQYFSGYLTVWIGHRDSDWEGACRHSGTMKYTIHV